MSLVTLEVDFEHGRIIPRGEEKLPDKGTGLLTVLSSENVASLSETPLLDWIERWQGTLPMPTQEQLEEDPRLDYLFKKYVK